MKVKYYCSICDKEIKAKETVWDLNDEVACESCFNDAVSQSEYAYESWRENDMLENQATGN